MIETLLGGLLAGMPCLAPNSSSGSTARASAPRAGDAGQGAGI